jgi:alpha-galactosidase
MMRDALLGQTRTILYSLCDWGQADVNTWGNETGNSWRMSGDISGELLPVLTAESDDRR